MKLNFFFKDPCFFINNFAGIYFCQLPKLKCFVDTNSKHSGKFMPVKISNNKVHKLKE